MTRPKILIPLLALLITLPLMAQTKKQFTLEDLMWSGSNYANIQPRYYYTTFWGETPVKLEVSEAYTLQTTKKGATRGKVLFTTAEVNTHIDTLAIGHVRNLLYATFPTAGKTEVLLYADKGKLLYDWKAQRALSLLPYTAGASNYDLDITTRAEAYTKAHNLYVRTADGREHQVSHDGSREVVYGESVHRDEFGITKGTFWSPKGTLLAFYRMDQSMVTDFPLVDISPRVATLAPEKYPMAGMTSHKVTVGIYNPQTDSTVYLQAGDPTDRYFTNIAWSPDEATVYMFELPRSQDKAELVAYDARSGERKAVLYTETNAHYVEPCHPIVFLPWDETKFVMQSRRDGYNNLYLFDRDGKELKQLTRNLGEVISMAGFNTKARTVIFKANPGNATVYNYYAVNVETGKTSPITTTQGTHYATLSSGGEWLIDRWSSPQEFRRYDLVSTTGKSLTTLHEDGDPWTDYDVPEITGGTIKAADGTTDLYYRLVKPTNFDPAKRYPAVVYVYGGPHAHNVEYAWNYLARPWEIYMAQRGYVVFVVDNRGSEYRGLQFEQATHRHLGEVEMADQMEGVKYLQSLPYVDADRLGVHGWSFGGFMTTNLMLTHPDVFKVGVAGGPVIDWKYYEVMYGERYMDTPDENPDGYAASSLLNKAANLKGRLQIIVGYNDPTCVLQHSLAFLRACEDAGTQPDYFVYPGDGHNMMGRDMIHLHERITRYFDDYLK